MGKGFQLCIVGPSGVGKSPVARLFPRLPSWDPYRVREPRDANDRTMSAEKRDQILQEARKGIPKLHGYAPLNLEVYKHWSFFTVRDTDQVLKHIEPAKRGHSLRLEIYSPVLVELLDKSAEVDAAMKLSYERLVVVMLNPTSLSYRRMESGPTVELKMATQQSVMERARVSGKSPDLADAMMRVAHLDSELTAWRRLAGWATSANMTRPTSGPIVVECLNWRWFEYRYHNDSYASNGAAESIRAELKQHRTARSFITTWMH